MDDARGRAHRHPRILLNALALRSDGSGVQRYARELARSLPSVWPEAAFGAVVSGTGRVELPVGVEAHERWLPFDHGLTRKLVAVLRQPRGFDLVHGLDADIPIRARVPTVVTVHDLALFDAPWAFARASGAAKRTLVATSIRRADAVIAVSTFTAERVHARFGRESTVVHEAPGATFVPPAPGAIAAIRTRLRLPEQFVLHVGNLEPRKDIATLARACEQAAVPLVLAGGSIRTVDVPAGVRALGYVPIEQLPSLYAAATVVGYVSRYEGFALPPIEALACGATVMATPVGALPDVAGSAVAFVPIADAAAQGRAIRDLANDPGRRDELRTAGLVASAALSWERAARATVEVYRGLLG
jgi:glycosyltransferase involved in cell wall biosynthesis